MMGAGDGMPASAPSNGWGAVASGAGDCSLRRLCSFCIACVGIACVWSSPCAWTTELRLLDDARSRMNGSVSSGAKWLFGWMAATNLSYAICHAHCQINTEFSISTAPVWLGSAMLTNAFISLSESWTLVLWSQQ